MSDVVLSVQNLKVSFYNNGTELRAVDDMSYDVHRGECVAIIGESGSGKSVSAMSLLRLVPDPPGKIKGGKILLNGEDILEMSEKQLRDVRGSKISMIFQEPSTALNPVIPVGKQITETLRVHRGLSKQEAEREAIRLLELVKIPNPEQRVKQYPFEFSGGMQQRVMIAIAMGCSPELLIADEPTTALDVTIQAQVLEQLNHLRREFNTALLMITHNLGVVARYADTVKIVYGGKIVESGSIDEIFGNPHHPYTLGLLRAVPRLDKPASYGLQTIEGEPPDMSQVSPDVCAFAPRCRYATKECLAGRPVSTTVTGTHLCACFHQDETAAEREALLKQEPLQQARASAARAAAAAESTEEMPVAPSDATEDMLEGAQVELQISQRNTTIVESRIKQQPPVPSTSAQEILHVQDLKMYFPVTKGLLKRRVADVRAVDGVSFQIEKGKTLGIVGESGSGKSTIGNCIMGNCRSTAGSIFFDGIDLTAQSASQLRTIHRRLQMITQNPFASLDPRMKVGSSIAEGIHVQKLVKTRQEEMDIVRQSMELVGLNPKFVDRYPHEFSGGQRQRISIARALALKPEFIICDEIVSALDVSIQSQIVNLMISLQKELNISYIFIGHDLSVVRHISDQVAVMYLGKIVEITSSAELYSHPLHPYTQALISAVPIPDPQIDRTRTRIMLEGEVPSPINPPKGCNFCTRCQYADNRCKEEEPPDT